MSFLGLHWSEWWVMATGVACAVACALPGCYLVLRRMSMLGDAISHAILPGLAIAFLVTGSRDVVPMLAGAMVVGMLTAVLTAGLSRAGRVPEDASMGVVFTSLFALGVILISFAARRVDLDANCVFLGEMLGVTTDMRSLLGVMMPRAFVVLAVVALLNATLISMFWKELKIASFDPALAASMGISAGVVHYALMAMVAGTTVASFEAVGSILVVAMLVGPGATAHLLTNRLGRMVVLAAILAATAAVAGYLLAVRLDTSVAGPMSVVVGVEFLLAVLFAPERGVLARGVSQLMLALRITQEDVLGMLYRVEEAGARVGAGDVDAALQRPLLARAAVWRARRQGMLRSDGPSLALTDAGRDAASRVVRSHRLWETYLARKLGLPLDHVHEPSHRVEHYITREVERGLREEVGTGEDPHGKRIPAR